MSLADALERAAGELPGEADAIRPANGDPVRLLESLDAGAAGRVLGWLLAHEADAAEELVEAWLEHDAGLAALGALDEGGLPKAGRKLLRRARHRLRSRGVALPEASPEERVAKLPEVDDAIEAALVTALDPSGARLVYRVEPDPSGGARLFEVAIDDRRGVLDASLYSASRSRVRAFLREVTGRSGLVAIEVPGDALRALLARAAARHPADRRLPGDFGDWKGRLTAGGEEAATPGQIVAEALGEELEPTRLREVAERVRAGALGPWPEPAEVLRPVADRIRERAESPVLVNAQQRREQAEAALVEALDEVYAGEAAAVAAERFRECAYVLWRRDEEAAARDCLAAAASFAKLPAAENPVARALLEVALGPLFESIDRDAPSASDEADEAEPEGSPILTKP